ncbi:MAG: GNAT family N-acetyltransferase [Rhodobacterales bacterium]|nr:GNAT family N-acetyltransferase [Rhodobacterales bacterium]
MAEVTIRDATPGDEAAWRALWADYTAFYRVDLPAAVTARTWARITDPCVPLTARLAVVDGAVQGFALHHTHLSTWAEGADCYLEDLFVAAPARGRGLGGALIRDLIDLCRARGYARLYWHTDQDNATARALYDRFAPADGHIRYRLRF